jgi:putative endonuclease
MSEPKRPSPKTARQKLGQQGERLALSHLTAKGYNVIRTNWHCKFGELDLVAWHDNCLVFIEVRTRRGNANGSPEESVDARKQARLQLLVSAFLQAESLTLGLDPDNPPACRIDVVAIEYYSTGQLARLEIIPNAVEG